MNIAYLVNQYPKVSHSFIRREILALERQGFSVQRIALRGWNDTLADAQDERERAQTRYVLQGAGGLALAVLREAASAPLRFARALGLAWRMGRRATRPWPVRSGSRRAPGARCCRTERSPHDHVRAASPPEPRHVSP